MTVKNAGSIKLTINVSLKEIYLQKKKKVCMHIFKLIATLYPVYFIPAEEM